MLLNVGSEVWYGDKSLKNMQPLLKVLFRKMENNVVTAQTIFTQPCMMSHYKDVT